MRSNKNQQYVSNFGSSVLVDSHSAISSRPIARSPDVFYQDMINFKRKKELKVQLIRDDSQPRLKTSRIKSEVERNKFFDTLKNEKLRKNKSSKSISTERC